MISVKRLEKNPILLPDDNNSWESYAVFNASVIEKNNVYHMVYRAISEAREWQGNYIRISSIGHAISSDGLNFDKRTQFIKPEYDWERFGCEDPRAIFIDNTHLIFYTAVSSPRRTRGLYACDY